MSSFLRLERKQKISSNAFRIRKFLLRFYSFGIETINTFILPRSSLENHTRFQTKMGKVYTRFQTKKDKKPYPFGRYIPIWLIWESSPPGEFTQQISWAYGWSARESQLYRSLFLPECRIAFFFAIQ